jgi:hypothetical protein
MSHWRIFLAWLIMAAVPLQGIAASSMLFCALDGHHSSPAHSTAAQHAKAQGVTSAAHDHGRHTHQKASLETAKAGSLPDTGHACGACGACCHSTAIAELPRWAAPQPAEQSVEAEPFVLIHTLASGVLDKPPRA